MHIRDYQPTDLEALTTCLIALQDVERNFNPLVADGATIAQAYFTDLMRRTEEEEGKILVAEGDGEIVGYVAIQSRVQSSELHEVRYEYAYISELIVREEWRGRGYGRALVSEAVAFAKANGAKFVRIGALAKNTEVRKLYTQCGFEEIEVVMEMVL